MGRKSRTTIGLIFCLFLSMSTAAFPWNQATHAHIADRLAARAGHDDMSEMWGSVGPDFFNYVFDPALCPTWISDQTHGTYSETFLKVWNAADIRFEDSLAYGFVSHNQQWGADYTAHISCRTCGQDDGYVIVKARQLLNAPLDPASPERTFGVVFTELGMDPDQGLLVAHLITEDAVDIRLRNDLDPLLGRKLARAARNETRRFSALLVDAYGQDYAAHCFGGDYSTAANVLTATEKQHRKDMIFLGQAISQPEPVAVQLLAEQVVAILPDFLGVPLPVPEEDVVEIMKAAIVTAITSCADYRAEIDATIEFVDENLNEHRITYSKHGKTKGGL
ncbi:hypothetical protein EG829_06995 [bacterium]|nr:hypothetical protein [bacterium]